jgi:putative flippase GtrA
VNLHFEKKIKYLFIEPSSNVAIQAFRAFFVGGFAFVVDASVLWIISLTGLHYLICAVFGFIAGLAVNYILSIKFVFKEKAALGKFGEISVYITVSLVGLGLTEVLLWLFSDVAGLYFMISKCITALLVFAWNFSSRKYLLYRNKKGETNK